MATVGAGTFVYEAPFLTPVAHLPPARGVLTTRSSSRFGLQNLDGSLTVYERDLRTVRTIPNVATASLSSDGAKLGVLTGVTSIGTTTGQYAIIDLATGSTQAYSVPNDGNGEFLAPRFNRSGTLVALGASSVAEAPSYRFATTYVYEGNTLIGTIPGQAGLWIDDSRLIARVAEGISVVTAEGIRTGQAACGFYGLYEPRQWLDTDRYLDEDGAVCTLSANSLVHDAATALTAERIALGQFGNQVAWRSRLSPAIVVP